MSRLKQVNLQVYSVFLYQSTFIICWKNASPSIESRFDFLKTIFLVVGKLGEAFFQQITKVLWYRNILYTCKLTCFNLLIVKYYGFFTLSFELNMSLSQILFPMHNDMNRLIKLFIWKKWHIIFMWSFVYSLFTFLKPERWREN